jgi:hypothetical protein
MATERNFSFAYQEIIGETTRRSEKKYNGYKEIP